MRSRDGLGTLTDLQVLPVTSQVLDRGDYLVIRTDGPAEFWFGNYVSLDYPPSPAEVEPWFGVCRDALVDLPDLHRLVLTWETVPEGHFRCEALPMATDYEGGVVMVREPEALPEVPSAALALRPIAGDAEWAAVTALDLEGFGEEGFSAWRMQAYRQAIEAGRGTWWGAWDGDVLAGSCGLFEAPDFLRFQEVVTRDRYRRLGVCTTLCLAALQDAWQRYAGARAVIVAEFGSEAERLYRKLGFRPVGLQHALLRSP